MFLSLQNRYSRVQSTFCLLLLCLFLGNVKAQDLGSFRKQKPIELRGSLSAGLQFYGVNGIQNRRQPFSWYLSGAPTLKIYGITMPFSLTVSEQERRFSQPFNQYGVSPYYNWIKLHLGYRNVRFGDFTLAGANFLGGGIELTPKGFRLGFVYGQFARAVEEDTSGTDPRYRYLRPTYQRLGWAAKVGFGKPKAYLDFSIFKASDIIGSIKTPSLRSRITPMDNMAVGLKNHFGLFKQKLIFDVELAASVLTRDSDTKRRKDIETTNQDLEALLNVMAINSSSAFFKALRANGSYQFKGGRVGLQYQRIDPDYQSLGAYFFQNDVEQITLTSSYSLFKNKLGLSCSLGTQHDNLNGKKSATTHRQIGALNLNLQPMKGLNIGLNYSNFGVGQSRGIGDMFNDSLAISVVNSALGGNVSYSRSTKFRSQSLNFSANYQNTNDQNQFSRQFMGASSMMVALGYNTSFIPQKITGSASMSYVLIETGGRKSVNIGPSLNVSRQWFKGKLRTSLNHNSQLRTSDGENDGLMSNTGFMASIQQGKQSLNVGGSFLVNRYKAQSDAVNYRNFNEFRGNITYGFRF
jgi:hypothetical protein